MAAITPNEAEARCLAKETSTNLDLVLFVNNLSPDESTTAVGVTEPSGGGYAPATITPGQWTITPGDPTEAVGPDVIWTLSSGVIPTVYGWALIERGSPDTLCRIERFDTPITVASQPGGVVAIRPRITAS